MHRHSLLAAAALFAAPVFAQSADKPLGDLLDAIPQERPAGETAPPPAPPPPPPVPRTGIGSTDLPPSAIEPVVETPAEGEVEAPVELTEEQKRLAELDAAERRRTEALNRSVTERNEAIRLANEEAAEAHRREIAAAEAEAERVAAEYRAAVERTRQQAVRERSLWEARVRACQDGDRSQCARPDELPKKANN